MKPRGSFRRLVIYARPYLALVLVALALAVVYAGGRTVRAYLLKPVVDDVFLASPALPALPGGATRTGTDPEDEGKAPAAEAEADAALRDVYDRLGQILALGIAAVLAIALSHFGKDYLTRYTLGRILVDVQQDLCAKLLALPLRFHHRVGRGDALSRVMNDAARAHWALDLVIADLVPSLLAVVVGASFLLSISWQLSLAALLVGPPLFGSIAYFGRRIRRSAKRRQETLGDVTQRLMDILSGIKVIKAFRAEAAERQAFQQVNTRYFRRSMKVVKNRVLSRTVVETINNGVAVGALGVGSLAVIHNVWSLSAGDLFAFLAILQSVYSPAKDLTKGWNSLMDSLPAADRFFELLDEPETVPEAAAPVHLRRVERGVRFRDVSFSYGREPVLRSVDFEVPAGQVVAIVGRTGAGKTTLADLILRFHDPDRGAIEIDGIDLRQLSRDSLLAQTAVVTQEPFLFPGSIADNIRYARPGASDAEVEAAAKAAHVDEFAAELPEGYDTEVGEGGVQLSGGQRQRVTIARAILRNPTLLIFDEATSALDARSERLVRDAIDQLLANRTVVVIAHRLSTVRRADRIVVLEGGRIAQLGTHDELMAAGGLYRELVELQNESV